MWESRQKAELNSAHTAANGLNFYSSGKASMNILSSRKFHVTHGGDFVTAAVVGEEVNINFTLGI